MDTDKKREEKKTSTWVDSNPRPSLWIPRRAPVLQQLSYWTNFLQERSLLNAGSLIGTVEMSRKISLKTLRREKKTEWQDWRKRRSLSESGSDGCYGLKKIGRFGSDPLEICGFNVNCRNMKTMGQTFYPSSQTEAQPTRARPNLQTLVSDWYCWWLNCVQEA